MKKTIGILTLVICIMILAVFGIAVADDESIIQKCYPYEYRVLENGTAEITGCSYSLAIGGTEENAYLAIPDTLDGYTVTSIGEKAFDRCYPLENISIPETVTKIGDYAFYYCDKLESINIPDSVTEFGANPFSNCYMLQNVAISSNHALLDLVDCAIITKTDHRLVSFLYGNFEEYSGIDVVIPDAVTKIGERAFEGGTCLDTVVIPDGVTEIGDYAFYRCWLSKINIPDSVTQIGANPFANCHDLRSIDISPNHPTFVFDGNMLYDNLSKRLICCVSTDKSGSYAIREGTVTIGAYAFASGYADVEQVSIPEGVMIIGQNAFEDCSFTSISLPGSLRYIGDMAFSDSSLTEISIPEGVTSIGAFAFQSCASLESVSLPDSITEIGANPFCDCSMLEDITVSPNHPVLKYSNGTLQSIPDSRFVTYLSTNTAEYYAIPDGTKSIDDYAFFHCLNLTEVTIPGSVSRIGDSAFRSCLNLENVEIQEGVVSIGCESFAWISDEAIIRLPGSVSHIEKMPLNCPYEPELFIVVPGSYAEAYCIDEGYSYEYAKQ